MHEFLIMGDAAPAAATTTATTAQPAPGAEGGKPAPQSSPFGGIMIPIIIFVMLMLFINMRSSKKQREKQQQTMNAIVKGARVRTIGGFIGTVTEVKNDTFMLELADKMPPVEIAKSAVAGVVDADTKSADTK